MTFHAWLLEQTSRDDPVGDLARDYEQGTRSSAHRTVTNPSAFRAMLSGCASSDSGAFAALDRAEREWDLTNIRL